MISMSEVSPSDIVCERLISGVLPEISLLPACVLENMPLETPSEVEIVALVCKASGAGSPEARLLLKGSVENVVVSGRIVSRVNVVPSALGDVVRIIRLVDVGWFPTEVL